MWSDWLVVCDCGFSLSALWCPLSVPTVLLRFLLPWMWGIFHHCSSKVQPLLLGLGVAHFGRVGMLSKPQWGIQHLLDHEKSKSVPKTSISALVTMPKPLTVWITINCWNILKEMGIPDHLTCLLRNLHASQEATVRTGHGTTDWFQIGKGVCQGCIL